MNDPKYESTAVSASWDKLLLVICIAVQPTLFLPHLVHKKEMEMDNRGLCFVICVVGNKIKWIKSFLGAMYMVSATPGA